MSESRPIRWFRLVVGTHSMHKKVYVAGEIIATRQDLGKLFNRQESTRFVELLEVQVPPESLHGPENPENAATELDEAPVDGEPVDLTKMSMKRLKKFAEDHAIAVPEGISKEDLIKRIQFAME